VIQLLDNGRPIGRFACEDLRFLAGLIAVNHFESVLKLIQGLGSNQGYDCTAKARPRHFTTDDTIYRLGGLDEIIELSTAYFI
jgi:hypothetical protein